MSKKRTVGTPMIQLYKVNSYILTMAWTGFDNCFGVLNHVDMLGLPDIIPFLYYGHL